MRFFFLFFPFVFFFAPVRFFSSFFVFPRTRRKAERSLTRLGEEETKTKPTRANKKNSYTLFQETYHRPTLKEVHVRGPKSDYDHRLLTHDRAMRAGLDDVGIGVLFGLADYRYEVLAMIQHAAHLEREYGAGPHTISVPRMRHAEGSDVSDAPPFPVDDANFKKVFLLLLERVGGRGGERAFSSLFFSYFLKNKNILLTCSLFFHPSLSFLIHSPLFSSSSPSSALPCPTRA